jgi:acyl-lipid Delta6-acetylenase / acyl-lipid (9-3)-desaturase
LLDNSIIMPKSQSDDFVPKKISHEELKKHRTLNDAWVSMGGKVYDISGWGGHPGGSVIYTHAGEDMTDAFNLFHAPAARKYLDEFYIGEIIEGSEIPLTEAEKVIKEKQRKFELAYRDLRGKVHRFRFLF